MNGDLGLDLRAMDFQAERDFGLGSYCDALKHYNLTNGNKCLRKFQELTQFISDNEVSLIEFRVKITFKISILVSEITIFEICLRTSL